MNAPATSAEPSASPFGDRRVDDAIATSAEPSASPFGDRRVDDAIATSDRIELRDLRVVCVIGVIPHERAAPQPISIDLDLYADVRRAGESDDVSDTVDYGEVCERIEALCADAEPRLLERMAELIAADLCRMELVTAATVTVTKLRPPVAVDLGTSAVRITRTAD